MRCTSRTRPRTMRSRSRSLQWARSLPPAGQPARRARRGHHGELRPLTTARGVYVVHGRRPGRRARHPAPAVTPVRALWPGCNVAAGGLLAPDLKEAASSVRDRVARDCRGAGWALVLSGLVAQARVLAAVRRMATPCLSAYTLPGAGSGSGRTPAACEAAISEVSDACRSSRSLISIPSREMMAGGIRWASARMSRPRWVSSMRS
jgi:hypothetical protein